MPASSKFVILTNPRNGSTWVGDVLNNMEDIVCYDELFTNPLYRKEKGYKNTKAFKDRLEISPSWYFYKYKRPFLKKGPLSLIGFLDKRLGSNKFGGFQLMAKQMMKHPTTCFYLLIMGVKIVRLKRENYLDIAVSQETMKHRKRGHQREAAEQISVHMDPEATLKEIRKCAFWDKVTDLFCRVMPMKTYNVTYEHLKENPDEWEKIVKFITGKKLHVKVESRYVKSNTADKKFIIKNYQELADYLSAKGYGHYF